MKKELKGFIGIAAFILILWGIFGLISGNGFFGGIGKEIDAIGDLVALALKIALIIGVIWLVYALFKKENGSKND